MDKTYLVLIVLALLTVKHTIFDFFLQSLSQIGNKRIYGHRDGLLHAGGHAAGTCLAFVLMPPPIVRAHGCDVAPYGVGCGVFTVRCSRHCSIK